jgi:hypothetical protein
MQSFTELLRNLTDELFTTLVKVDDVRTEPIISHGHASTPGFWYDQPPHAWVFVLNGPARLQFGATKVSAEQQRCQVPFLILTLPLGGSRGTSGEGLLF